MTVFGSATPLEGEEAYEEARRLGRRLAAAGFTLCNGGYGGTMEAAARGAREAGGVAVGVTFPDPGGRNPNPWLHREIRCGSLLERVQTLIAQGDAYIILPGGTGTLLELSAVWELMSKGFVERRPLVLLGGFWEGVVGAMREQLIREGRTDAASLPVAAADAAEAVEKLLRFFA